MNQLHFAALSALLLATACGERAETPPADEPPVQRPEPVGVIASDAIGDLSAAPAGVDFWTHPNVAFNSLIIVASDDGLVSYNVEDGDEVNRVSDVRYRGVAVSYIGFGPLAAGVAATFDENAGAFRFFGIDNASRLFLPLTGGPSINGAVRGFCMGRATGVPDPALFVIQEEEMTIFNIAPLMDGDAPALAVNGETGVSIPGTVTACTVDSAGIVYLLADDGEIYRVGSDSAFAAPFAIAYANDPDGIVFLGSASDDTSSVRGQIAVLDGDTGTIEVFDASDGHALGAVRIDAGADISAVDEAVVIGGSAANLGGLYRDGAIALGTAGDTPGIRLIPANGVSNALGAPALSPANPRGATPVEPQTNGLIINPTLPESE